MLRFRALIAIWLLILSLFNMPPAPTVAQGAADYAIANGHFFTQTSGGQGGFSVADDDQARFWSEFNRLGGLQNVGYPISQRFLYDGFVTQAFQKLVLQWRPEVGQAWPVNVFDELSEKGFDDTLYALRQTPYPLQNFDPPGTTWEQVVASRQALLDANPAIRARYFAAADPLNVYGLPVSRVEDMGNHYAIRTQRAVFQQWKENVPWATEGQVTIANGGDIGKELGWLSGTYLQPEAQPGAPVTDPGTPTPAPPPPDSAWKSESVAIGPGRTYVLQADENYNTRLMVSEDGGDKWKPLEGSVARRMNHCPGILAVPASTPHIVYANLCSTSGSALARFTSNAWTELTMPPLEIEEIAVADTQPEVLYACPATAYTFGRPPMRSNDGGFTWIHTDVSAFEMLWVQCLDVAVDPHDADLVYAALIANPPGVALWRSAGGDQWTSLPIPDALKQWGASPWR